VPCFKREGTAVSLDMVKHCDWLLANANDFEEVAVCLDFEIEID